LSERPRWNWFGKAVVVESMRWGIGMLEKKGGWMSLYRK